jgi:hypothetical protein
MYRLWHDRWSQKRGELCMELTPTHARGFVIALCAMTSAIPIPQPRSAPLNRFRFFLTRRKAEGRALFVLHMGHFTTASEADEWLERLRGTYPNAYVSAASEASDGPSSAELSDTQVLRVLEARQPAPTHEAVEISAPPAPETRAPVSPPPLTAKEGKAKALEESLQNLAARESPTGDYEALSDTGVRHLSIEVQKPSKWLWRPRTR